MLGEATKANTYLEVAARMKRYIPNHNRSKEAASLLSLANVINARIANAEVIAVDGPKKFSTFFGYYMLQGQAKAGDYLGALNNIRRFRGGMLDLSATTFWEEFDLEEAQNAAPIDDMIPAGRKDYHRDTGAECYIGLPRSCAMAGLPDQRPG